jgi:sigma-B regulation protein RsbU (phosphoserine phosphatase)
MEKTMQRTHHKFQSATNLRNGKLEQSSIAPLATRQIASVPIQSEVSALLREKLDLHAQLFEAAQIQRKLSGPRELRCGDIEFASEVFAARYLSGDFTMLLQNDSRVTATLGDIAGKGIAAGMWFTNLAGLLQSYGHPDSDPSMTAAEINRRLCDLRPGAPFVTAFLAQVDCRLGALKYCNAGHFPPILLRADGRTELLETGGPLLGAIEGAGYKSAQVMLEPGDTVVAYSDGLLECRDASGEEFGSERLTTAARQSLKSSAHAVLLLLLAAVQDFANGTLLGDDLSLTVIQRRPESFAA